MPVLATSLGHLRGSIRVLLDPRVTGSRYSLLTVFETLPHRSDVIECLNKLLARYPTLKGAAKVQKELQDLLKLMQLDSNALPL